MFDPRLLQLSSDDNVLLACKDIPADDSVLIAGTPVTLKQTIATGHKVAAAEICKNDQIIKYGAPIGVACENIAVGEHVHIHNIRSDYTPTHSLDEARKTSDTSGENA